MNIENYTDKYNEITKLLLVDMIDNGEGKNIIMSPLSVLVLLGIAAESVSGNTRDEALGYLRDSVDQDIIQILTDIEKIVQKSGNLKSANAVIIAEKLKDIIKEDYISKIKDMFDAEVFSTGNIIRDVNEWVNHKTNGMIKEIANDSMEDMQLALINAISFISDWEEIYEEDDINTSKFNNLDGTESKVEMMRSSEYSYIENEFYTGFTKDYKGEEFCYMALLPKKKRSKSFFKRAITNSNLTDLFKKAENIEVIAGIPEYKAEFSENLKVLLKRNGINQMFTDAADYTPVTDKVPLKTDSILHKAYIEVDRRGTKAAAVTYVCVAAGCAPGFDYREVTLDRPFVYAIIHKKTGLPVFIGTVNNL